MRRIWFGFLALLITAEYKTWLQRDFDTWGKVIQDAGIKPAQN